MTLRQYTTHIVDRIGTGERARLVSHGVALGAVAAAVVVRSLLGVPRATTFAPFYAAVAISALQGGWSPALVAMLASVLTARVGSSVTLGAAGWFCVDGLLVAAVVGHLRESFQRQHRRSSAADSRLRELKAVEQRGRAVAAAFGHLQETCSDTAIAILDDEGRIADWGEGAARLYSSDGRDVRGASAAGLFDPVLTDEVFGRLLSDARHGVARHSGRHRRADGTSFDAEVEIRMLSRGPFSGYTMVVHDLSRQQAWDAFARSATETETRLREEADAAHSQLEALQHVTDPSLDVLTGAEVVATLLERLRLSVGADGVALVHVGAAGRRVVCAAEGLQCLQSSWQPDDTLRRHQPGHTLLIHNDRARVSDMSCTTWPDTVTSLIAVPVVRTGAMHAVIEVVNTRVRRSTEWEIALIQVVAARIAGVVQDAYAVA